MKFVDGNLDVPDHETHFYEPWEWCNVMILYWINHTLSPNIVEGMTLMWLNIFGKIYGINFQKGDHFRLSDLLQEIPSIKQGERNVKHFYTYLKIIWKELESLKLIPRCT